MSDGVLRQYMIDECGEDGYPYAWHAEIKHLVREQAGFRCVRCLHPYRAGDILTVGPRGEWSRCDVFCRHQGGEVRYGDDDCWTSLGSLVEIQEALKNPVPGFRVEARWRILTVHHLDENKANCRWWNLAPLCQRCHLTIQTRVHLHQVYVFAHSDWFKPYAAGYYAWHYLGEELSRDETMARLDELLALELIE